MSEIDSEELISVEHKCKSIESLVRYARQIAKLSSGLETLREVIKPSQQARKKKFQFLISLIEKLQPVPAENLERRLKRLDSDLKKEIETIIQLSEISENEFYDFLQARGFECFDTAYQALESELKEFKRMSQTNLAIRINLHERGVLLNAIELPIGQDKLANELNTLRKKESRCRKKIEEELIILIEDTEKILAGEQYPNTLKQQLRDIHVGLKDDLVRLRGGASLEEFTSVIEAIELGHQSESTEDAEEENHVEISAKQDTELDFDAHEVEQAMLAASETKRVVEFEDKELPWSSNKVLLPVFFVYRHFVVFRRWLFSPWNRSWKTINDELQVKKKNRGPA